MGEFVTIQHYENDSKRWWIIRRPEIAVSLTAVQVSDEMAALVSTVRDTNLDWLMADEITLHYPGTGEVDCPTFEGGCDGLGGTRRGAHALLKAWAAASCDDTVIRQRLTEIINAEQALAVSR